MLENTDAKRDKLDQKNETQNMEPKNLQEKKRKHQRNIDYNQPSPSASQERKTCQIGYCKRNRRNRITPVQSVKRLYEESVQAKLSICVKDARNKCRVLK